MLPARSLVSNLLESETTKGEREKSSQNKCNSGLKWSNIHSRPSYNTTNQNIAKRFRAGTLESIKESESDPPSPNLRKIMLTGAYIDLIQENTNNMKNNPSADIHLAENKIQDTILLEQKDEAKLINNYLSTGSEQLTTQDVDNNTNVLFTHNRFLDSSSITPKDNNNITNPLSPIVIRWQKAIKKVMFINRFTNLHKDIHSSGIIEERIPFCIILPNSGFKFFWSIMLVLALSFTAIYVPIRLAFIEQISTPLFIMETIIDSLFFIDLFVNFLTAYYEEDHKLIVQGSKIAKKYLKGWFLIDIVALFPFWVFEGDGDGQSMSYNKLLRLLRLSRLYRILRLFNFMRIFEVLQQNKTYEKILIALKMNSGIKRLIKAILTFFFLCHLFACFWFYIARFNNFDPDTWVVTLTTIGYGDLFPYTTTERIVSIFYIMAGVTFVSYSIGTLTSILQTSDSKAQNLKKRMLVLDELALTLHMNSNLYYKLKQIIRNNHETQFYSNMNYESLLEELPSSLRAQLVTLIFDENKLGVIKFFQKQNPNFLNMILPLLKRITVEKDEVIYKDGDMADEMYFILEGKIQLASADNFVFRIVDEGAHFGEQEIIQKREDYRNNSAIAVEPCKLIVLKKNDLLNVLELYPEVSNQLIQESKLKMTTDKELLVRAKFANSQLKSSLRNRIRFERKNSIYNRDFHALTSKAPIPKKAESMSIQSDSSQISNGLETINDVSELDEDSPNPHGKTKIVWEEESEDLECSNLYSSDQEEGKRENSTPIKLASNISVLPPENSMSKISIGEASKIWKEEMINRKRKSMLMKECAGSPIEIKKILSAKSVMGNWNIVGGELRNRKSVRYSKIGRRESVKLEKGNSREIKNVQEEIISLKNSLKNMLVPPVGSQSGQSTPRHNTHIGETALLNINKRTSILPSIAWQKELKHKLNI